MFLQACFHGQIYIITPELVDCPGWVTGRLSLGSSKRTLPHVYAVSDLWQHPGLVIGSDSDCFRWCMCFDGRGKHGGEFVHHVRYWRGGGDRGPLVVKELSVHRCQVGAVIVDSLF